MGFVEALDRVNAAHPWSHNDAFAGFVLRHARAVRRRGGDTAVDAGCGTGALASALSEVFPAVIGIEPDADAAASAAQRLAGRPVRVEQRRFGAEPEDAYDLIVFVASLHHMPLRATLQDARAALRPGGRIVIVGLARETSADLLRSATSLLLNPLIGMVRGRSRAAEPPVRAHAPTAPATRTFDEIRAIAADVLPGIRMRRRLFWRYTAHWEAPGRPL